MLTIAPGTSDDLPALVALDPIAGWNADRRSAIAEWIAAGQCHVAQLDGRAAGYAALTHSFFHSPYIEMLMVADWARRQGVARSMVQHCISLVPPAEKLWTSANQSNAPMRALLPQLGFIHTGTIDHLDEGDPELIYLRWTALGA